MNKKYLISPEALKRIVSGELPPHEGATASPPAASLESAASGNPNNLPDDVLVKLMNRERVKKIRSKPKSRTHIPHAVIGGGDLNYFSKSNRAKAAKLIDALGKSGVSWNRRGEVFYEGRIHPGSHILSLVDSAIRPASRPRKPQGVENFEAMLNRENIAPLMRGRKKYLKPPSAPAGAEVELPPSPVHSPRRTRRKRVRLSPASTSDEEGESNAAFKDASDTFVMTKYK